MWITQGDQIKNSVMGGTCGTYGDRLGAYRVLVGKPKRKRPLGRPRRIWEDNIKMDLQRVGWGHGLRLISLRIGTGGGPL